MIPSTINTVCSVYSSHRPWLADGEWRMATTARPRFVRFVERSRARRSRAAQLLHHVLARGVARRDAAWRGAVPALSARSTLESSRRYRSGDENGARRAAASRRACTSNCKLRCRLTPVEFLALRIDVLHVENIFEQHTRHVANTDYPAIYSTIEKDKMSPGTYKPLGCITGSPLCTKNLFSKKLYESKSILSILVILEARR